MNYTKALQKELEEFSIQYDPEEVSKFLANYYNITDWFKDGEFVGTFDDDCLYGKGFRIEGVDAFDIDVLNDSDAEDAWDESLESYIDDCLFTEDQKNSALYTYFNREDFKGDCYFDGIHHSLSSYDGAGEEGKGFYAFHN